MLFGLSFLTFLSTLAGGLFALRYRRYIQSTLAFTAGVLLALLLFHILPEIVQTTVAGHYGWALAILPGIAGYFSFHTLHHFLHRHHDHEHKHPAFGITSALALASHSFLDGVAIGLAFHINASIGLAVALAVIAHDFADGLNAVNVMLAYRNSLRRAAATLLLVALAPVAGLASTLLFTLPEVALLWYLGGFAGFIVYFLSRDMLPQIFKQWRWASGLLATLGVMFVLVVMDLTKALG